MSINNRLINTGGGGGIEAFEILSWTGDGANSGRRISTSLEIGIVWILNNTIGRVHLFSKKQGNNRTLSWGGTGAEQTYIDTIVFDGTNDILIGDQNSVNTTNFSGHSYTGYFFSIPNLTTSTNFTANQEAGLSVGKYLNQGDTPVTAHNLGNQPHFMMVKNQYGYIGVTAHKGLNQGDGYGSYQGFDQFWNNTSEDGSGYLTYGGAPDATNFYLKGNDYITSKAGQGYVGWMFAPIAGFSDFGWYAGSAGTVSVNFGFQPSFVIIKRYDQYNGGNWVCFDSLKGNTQKGIMSSSVATTTVSNFNFTSTGFEVSSGDNDTNAGIGTALYTYSAFKGI